MNKLANMRHWSGPGFGMSRPNMNVPSITTGHNKNAAGNNAASMITSAPTETAIHYSFNVPFASDLAGPNTEDILYATAGAVLRWTHPEDAPDNVPIYELPVHANNVTNLRKLCRDITLNERVPVEAHVKSSEPKRVKGQVTNVCLSGLPESVHATKEQILNETPLALVDLPRPSLVMALR